MFIGITDRQDYIGNLDEEKIDYFYPSVSAAWVVNESIELPDMIDLLKIRLGYANVGNGLTRIRNIDTYSFESPDWSSTVKTSNLNATLVDPKIKPMSSITKEAGFDLWMFNKKIAFDFTYFIKDQINQIGGIPVVQGTGYTQMTTNIGDVRNEGYEWGLTVNPIRTKDIGWDLTATFTHYKAKITRLTDNFAPSGYVFASYDGKTKVKIAKGEEIRNIYEENPILKVKTGKYAGVPLLDNDGKFQRSADERDRAQLANFNPDYIVGLNTTFRYKRLSLNMVGSLRLGGDYISVNQQYMDSNGRSFESVSSGPNNPWWNGGRDASQGGMPWPAAGASKYPDMNGYNDDIRSDFNDASYAKGVWLIPGTDPNNDANYIVNGADPNNTFYDFPYNAYGDVIWNFTATRVYDATNFKMKEVSLVYNLPNTISEKINVSNVNIALVGRNVFQWNASGRNEDPETAFSGPGVSQGVLRATLPPVRSLGFKLSFDF